MLYIVFALWTAVCLLSGWGFANRRRFKRWWRSRRGALPPSPEELRQWQKERRQWEQFLHFDGFDK